MELGAVSPCIPVHCCGPVHGELWLGELDVPWADGAVVCVEWPVRGGGLDLRGFSLVYTGPPIGAPPRVAADLTSMLTACDVSHTVDVASTQHALVELCTLHVNRASTTCWKTRKVNPPSLWAARHIQHNKKLTRPLACPCSITRLLLIY